MRALLVIPLLLSFILLGALPARASDTTHAGHGEHEAGMVMEQPLMPEAAQPAPATDTPTELVPEVMQQAEVLPEPVHAAHAHTMAPLSPAGLPQAAPDRFGGMELESTLSEGVRVFTLSADELAWPLTGDVTVAAYAYNGQVPGPLIRAKAGEKIRINFTNNLAEPTTIHWHGVDVPVEMDGVPGVSQEPVAPGATFTYEFTVPETPGTFFYHSHVMPDKQQALGLSGAFIIEPATPPAKPQWEHEHTLVLGEWTVKDGGNLPSMPMEGMFPNFFTINGKSWPATERLTAKVGERVLLRVVNAGAFAHPVHLHGAPFRIIASDGHPIPATAQLTKDTLNVAPGERYDLLWTPTRPGTWLVHCHINHHTMNDSAEVDGMGGMALAIDVSP